MRFVILIAVFKRINKCILYLIFRCVLAEFVSLILRQLECLKRMLTWGSFEVFGLYDLC